MLLAELFPYANAVFYVFTALYIITAIGCIIVVVSENRNPVRSLAWVTVLLLLPVVGILVYLFFGRSLKSVMMISRNNRMKRRGQASLNTPESSNFSLSESSLQIINLVNSLGEPHFFKTNQVDIFTEGEAKFSQLKADLLAAKKYINFRHHRQGTGRNPHSKSPRGRESEGNLRPCGLVEHRLVVFQAFA